MRKTLRFDVVVAGLGPAGAVALWHLARMGFSVAGVDMRGWDELWGKPCGDAIGAHHFSNAKLPPPPSDAVKNRVTAIDVYSPGLRARYRVEGEGFIIDRRALGRTLVREAVDRGAEVLLRTSVLEPIVENGSVRGVVARTSEGLVELRAGVVIEATGSSRAIARRLPPGVYAGDPIDPRDYNIAYREVVEFEAAEVEEPTVLRIYLDKEVAPGGYWWFFPEGRSTANVGLGVQGGRGYPHPLTLYRSRVAPATEKAYGRYRVVEAGGAPVPTRRPAVTLVGNGVMVIGDAGYTVNPLHGGGMGYSFYAAYLAAQALSEAYDRGSFTARDLWKLNTAYMRSLGAKQAALDVFRMFLQELENSDIAFAMEKRIIPEPDVYDVSVTGQLRVSVVDKALAVIRGLRRPSLLLRLKQVADYMERVRSLYLRYPEDPSELPKWVSELNATLSEYRERVLGASP